MKAKIFGGAAAALATVALALGAPPAEARHKAHRAPKAAAEKHKCGGKNGCPAMSKTEDKAPAPEKPADAKPAESKPAEGK
ncbi:hypothetical protein [Methylocystis echinoides]|jgi:hypothetical protein|uniref:hypothetical protein n=1 Tax=Methylocystis echinoides TaxID=29468 RepID=UPI00343416C9